MAQSSNSIGLWIAAIIGLVAIGTWFALGGTRDTQPAIRPATPTTNAPAKPSQPQPVPQAAVQPAAIDGLHRIADHGRLTLDHAALAGQKTLDVQLELPDDARGAGERSMRVVSTDGRRIDTTATPLPGPGSGVRASIDTGFLTPGRYMIEVDTVATGHPLNISRYVVEIQ